MPNPVSSGPNVEPPASPPQPTPVVGRKGQTSTVRNIQTQLPIIPNNQPANLTELLQDPQFRQAFDALAQRMQQYPNSVIPG
jgi:hypothetical protein